MAKNLTLFDFKMRLRPDVLYVDKTDYLYKLNKLDGVFYSISRPRWFGTSLLIQTLELMYRGRRDVFKGLAIDNTDYSWTSHPVLVLNFSLGSESPAELRRLLAYDLNKEAERFGITLEKTKNPALFYRQAIERLSQVNKIVILIDEFDKPLMVNAAGKQLDAVLQVYREFFSVLDESKDKLKLCLAFGTTAFAGSRLSPALDNFIDLTFSDDYAALFGYTQEELEENFSEYIENGKKALRMGKKGYSQQMKSWFGGYRFSSAGEEVYHPGFITRFFSSESEGTDFKDYWVMIGRIGDVIRKRAAAAEFDLTCDRETQILQSELLSKDIIDLSFASTKEEFMMLLYWYGYFTVKKAVPVGNDNLLTLGYTNMAMENNLKNLLTWER